MTDFNEKDCDELYFEGIMVPENQIQQFQSNGPFMNKITYKLNHSNHLLFEKIVNPISKQKRNKFRK
jgi:hypothetical protein